MAQIWVDVTGPTFWAGLQVWDISTDVAWSDFSEIWTAEINFVGSTLRIRFVGGEGFPTAGGQLIGARINPTAALFSAIGEQPIHAVRLSGNDPEAYEFNQFQVFAGFPDPEFLGLEDRVAPNTDANGDFVDAEVSFSEPAPIIGAYMCVGAMLDGGEFTGVLDVDFTKIEVLIDEPDISGNFWTNRILTREIDI